MPTTVIIQPLRDRIDYDIEIPSSRLVSECIGRRLADLDVSQLDAIDSQQLLDEPLRHELRMEFATPETQVRHTIVVPRELPHEKLVMDATKLLGRYTGFARQCSVLYPIVFKYIRLRCFGTEVSLSDHRVRQFLSKPEVREAIAQYLAPAVSRHTIQRDQIELADTSYQLSATKPFSWRCDLPALKAEKTVFNFVATHNLFEREFAEFLDGCSDISRFAALGTTDQGSSGMTVRVDYVNPSGEIGFYYPDWVAVQESDVGIVNWIIETKGRVGSGTEEEDGDIGEWCSQVTSLTGHSWKFLRVNQSEFSSQHSTFRSLSVSLIANRMFRRRARQPRAVSLEMIRALREEVRK